MGRKLSCVAAAALLALACRHSAPERAAPPASRKVELQACAAELPPRVPQAGPLSAAEREAIVRDVQARRLAWQARGITDYRLLVAAGCFCPWSHAPAILEVRGAVAAALRDTAGGPVEPVREPWSLYTVDGLFDAVERAARWHDVVEVRYDACYGYPADIRGDAKVGQVDDWYWVRASHLTPVTR